MNTVKIIAMSDLHERRPDVDVAKYDICVIAGDFCSAAICHNDIAGSFRWLSGAGRKWLKGFPSVQFVIVPGNHDLAMTEKRRASDYGWPDNVHLLIDETWTHPESGLAFYGTPWSTLKNGGAFSVDSAELTRRFAKIPEGIDIVVTHSPPDIPGTGLTGTAVCSPELTVAIERAKPLLLLCGHEHRLDHHPVQMRCGTVAVNLALLNHRGEPHVWRPREIILNRNDGGAWEAVLNWEDDMRKILNTDELYAKLNDLPLQAGRWLVRAEHGSPSCRVSVVEMGNGAYFCISCNAGDMFKTVDDFRSMLSRFHGLPVIWGGDRFWEESSTIEWFGVTGLETLTDESRGRRCVLLQTTNKPIAGPSVNEFEAGRSLTEEIETAGKNGGEDSSVRMAQGDFIKMLRDEAADHRSLYHYTRWDAFVKMMRPVVGGPCDGHLMMLLSPADKMNDKVEKGWGPNVFMTCFSYSKYEDVAMWMNYGKRSPDAVRVRLDGGAVANWHREHSEFKQGVFSAREDGNRGFIYEPLDPECIASIELADVGYVIHSKLMTDRHWGNVEYSRRFYRVMDPKNGLGWSDNIYDGSPREGNPQLPAYFKKRGWGYERETRLIITLKKMNKKEMPHRLAIIFDEPFAPLSDVVNGRPSFRDYYRYDEELWGERGGHHPIMRGPWFNRECASDVPAGVLHLSDVPDDSDYASEIEIISAKRMSIPELIVQADERLRQLEGRDSARCKVVERDDKHFLKAVGGDLISVAKTINFHIMEKKNYRPNLYKLARLEIIDPRRLAELSFVDKQAKSYLDALRQVVVSAKRGWTSPVEVVEKYND